MNSRQRLLRTINHKIPDRVPWSPFLEFYFLNAQNEEAKEKGIIELSRELKVDIIARNIVSAYKVHSPNVKTTTYINGQVIDNPAENNNWQLEIYDMFSLDKYRDQSIKFIEKKFETPVGMLSARYVNLLNSRTVFQDVFPIQNMSDLNVLKFMYKDIQYVPNYTEVEKVFKNVGNDGIVSIGVPGTPVVELIEEYIGLENFHYLLHDYTIEIKELMELMLEKNLEAVEIAAKSPSDFLIIWEDTGTSLYSKKIFVEIVSGMIKKIVDRIHEQGKPVALHSCGLINDILYEIKETGVDIIESVTTYPTGNVNMLDMKKKMGNDICIMGGIDPTVITSQNEKYLIEKTKELIQIMKPDGNFVLANGDALPADTPVKNLFNIYEIVEQYGYY
ncbi:MAG: hypothetical protein M1371_09730 [Actinobacteria bacterium]|nr:hypothetical protein [Actinomycetota bacterium]